MSESPVGLLVVFVYVGAVIGSVPVALLTLLLARRTRSFARALAYSLGGGVALFVLGSVALAVLVAPLAGGTLLLVGLLAVATLGVVPLAVGRELVVRVAGVGLDRDGGLKWATAGWPVALNVSFALFVAPGGPARYNVTFLTGIEGILTLGALLAVVVLGPGLVGVGLARAFEGGD